MPHKWKKISDTEYRLGAWSVKQLPVTKYWMLYDWFKLRYKLTKSWKTLKGAMKYVEKNT